MDEKFTIPSIRLARINSLNLLKDLLETIPEYNANVVIASYAVTEEWLRRLVKLKEEKKIQKITIILDRIVILRHRSKLLMLQKICDVIALSDSHAKLFYVETENHKAAAITSANATNNYRNEVYYATNRESEIRQIESDIADILRNAYFIK